MCSCLSSFLINSTHNFIKRSELEIVYLISFLCAFAHMNSTKKRKLPASRSQNWFLSHCIFYLNMAREVKCCRCSGWKLHGPRCVCSAASDLDHQTTQRGFMAWVVGQWMIIVVGSLCWNEFALVAPASPCISSPHWSNRKKRALQGCCRAEGFGKTERGVK